MCGRFTLRTPGKVIGELFGLDEVPELAPRYNIAPSSTIAGIRHSVNSAGREFARFSWGLVPSWSADPALGMKMTNARSETAATKPSFRKALKCRRCVILADGFYEWRRSGSCKQPFYIRRKDDLPFLMGGLWERWSREGVTLESCAILTTTPNELMAPIHDRMPVMVAANRLADWLDPTLQEEKKISRYFEPCPAEEMLAYPVSTLVNNARNESPQCMVGLEA